jgi:hypothetical protein
MSLAARCRQPLYELQLSANNADSTLRIVKEQQPTFSSLRLANLNSDFSLAEVCQP